MLPDTRYAYEGILVHNCKQLPRYPPNHYLCAAVILEGAIAIGHGRSSHAAAVVGEEVMMKSVLVQQKSGIAIEGFASFTLIFHDIIGSRPDVS